MRIDAFIAWAIPLIDNIQVTHPSPHLQQIRSISAPVASPARSFTAGKAIRPNFAEPEHLIQAACPRFPRRTLGSLTQRVNGRSFMRCWLPRQRDERGPRVFG